MAQEVNLNSLQDSDWEVILQVLYRDRAVQHMEEERIRYASLEWVQSFGAFSAGSLLPRAWHMAPCLRLGLWCDQGPVTGGGWRPPVLPPRREGTRRLLLLFT